MDTESPEKTNAADTENTNAENLDNTNSEGPEKEKKRKIKPLYIIIGVLALILAATLVYFLWPSSNQMVDIDDGQVALTGRGTLLTPENIDEVRRRMEEPSPDAQYMVSMTTNWLFETALTPSRTAIVNNREVNTRTVFFEVTLRETGQLVYTSPYIPLGGTLNNFALDVNLRAGTYDAIARFILVDDDYEPITDVAVTVTLTIEG